MDYLLPIEMTRQEIRQTRLRLKISQAELARRTKLTAPEISRIECGYRDMDEAEHAAITSALATGHDSVGQGLTKSKAVEPPEAQETPAPVPAPMVKPPVVGTDLSDPANFGVLPEMSLLQTHRTGDADFRARCAAEIAKANTILHTPRVPAAVWREWRQFEKLATEILRSGVAVSVEPAPVIVQPVPVPPPSEKPEPKSFSSLFVESARKILPVETVDRLNKETEAACASDPSMGFMKHFRRKAENTVSPELLRQISDEAGKLLSSPDRLRSRRGRKQAA